MDASLNIVNLIENNPIIKLSTHYNNRFVNKIKETFTDSQQQLFVSSLYCYLNHNKTTEFIIDLDNIWKWLGFTVKQSAKTLLEKHFIIDKDYKVLLKQTLEQTNDTRGGHNKQTILLNINTFKLFCIKADTKKANEIHEYFIKLEELLQEIIQEESDELKKQLEDTNKNFDKKLLEEKKLQKQGILFKQYQYNKSIVYIIKVKTYENGDYVIKIGESRNGIESRYNEHKKNYEECLLLDCFEVNKSKQFEHFLHHHDKIRPNRVKDLSGHEKEHELFKINNNFTYDMLLKIINDNISNFNEWKVGDIVDIFKEENQKFLDKITSDSSLSNTIIPSNEYQPNNIVMQNLLNKLEQLENTNNILLQKIEKLETQNSQILEHINKPQIKTTTNFNTELVTLGPRLQKINPSTGSIVKVYESVADCIKESKYKLKRPSIDKAIKENTVYRDYRWMYVDRNSDPNIITNYQPTKVTRSQNVGYVAKLNIEKTKILNVYLDRKTASLENGFASPSALDESVKNNKPKNGYIYTLYDKCDTELQDDFEDEYGEPILYKDGIGQYDSNNQLIKEYVCKYDCIKQMQISDKTLRKALEQNILYNNYYYKSLGTKLKMI